MRRITFNNTEAPASPVKRTNVRVFGELEKGIVPVFSGKTALSLLLRYYRSTGALEHKAAEVLVPAWMGSWVTMIMQKQCFPTTTFNSRVRGLLLYHQWGFPQRVDDVLRFAKKKNLFVIEDCAHAFEGRIGGRRLGTFGDAAVFSLAKFFPCGVGGAVYSADRAIRRFVAKALPLRSTPREKEAFDQRVRYDREPSEKESFELERNYGIYDRLLKCDDRALAISADQIARGAMARRRAHSERLREEFDPRDRFDLYGQDVVPWIVPLFFGKTGTRRVAEALRKAGVESGVFHFDINRNMLDPDYRECVAVPCHDGIADAQMESIMRIIRANRS